VTVDALEAEPDLLPRLGAFARLLHDVGMDAGPGRLASATEALAAVGVGDPAAFRDALRTCFVSRREELAVFEAAFDLFWSTPNASPLAGTIPGRSQPLPLSPERARAWAETLGLNQRSAPKPPEEEIPAHSSGYTHQELLRRKDFDQLTWDESEQIKRLLQQSPWRIAQRRTRRLRPARAGEVDLRRTARHSIRSGGEAMHIFRRQTRVRRRPLILLCDVSGSMERYSRLLLIFAHAVARRENVETFVFSTRLTRLTRQLRQRDVDVALDRVAKQVHDFSGGTRIGDALAEFNRRWARRVLGHGAVVIVISDGWDRGEPERLAQELERLRRSCHRLIWLNPLLGSDGYQPVTRGMAAALPHLDEFMAAHSLEALDELGRFLAGLDRRRPQRMGLPSAIH
jgi:hypothetical protein